MFCPDCRTAASDDVSYCPRCGHRLFAWMGDPFGNLEPSETAFSPSTHPRGLAVRLSPVSHSTDPALPYPWGKAIVAIAAMSIWIAAPASAPVALLVTAVILYGLSLWRPRSWWSLAGILLAAWIIPLAAYYEGIRSSYPRTGTTGAQTPPARQSAPLPTPLAKVPQALSTGNSPTARDASAATGSSTTPPQVSVQSVATATSLAEASKRVFGPEGGWIQHLEDGTISSRRASVTLRDFDAEVRFNNPLDQAAWDYGFVFRNSSLNDGYWLYVDSDSRWHLVLARNAGTKLNLKVVQASPLSELDISAASSNRLRLVALGAQGFFLVNDKLISILPLDEWPQEGAVLLGTGFGAGHQVQGGRTGYSGFAVWSLK